MIGASGLRGSPSRGDGYSAAFLFPAIDLGTWHPVASPPPVFVERATRGHRTDCENSDHPEHFCPPLPAPLDRSTRRSCRTRETVAASPEGITVTAPATKRNTWHTP
jgi:hypothetical protein